MGFVDYLVSKQPNLKKRLIIAKINQIPKQYITKSLKSSLLLGLTSAILLFFIMSKNKPSVIIPLFVGVIAIVFFYTMSLKKIDVAIRKKAKDIDKGVLFAGRFLLIKLNSGDPLINSIEEAANSYGLASNYFREIIKDIELGTPLEQALDKATEYCPSKHLKKILFQITNALKIGIDVTDFLGATIDEIAEEQLVEIMKYGKKLSSLTMFYMLLAIIVPSLGMTLFVVIASLVSIKMDMTVFVVILFVLIFVQFMFITLFKAARPNMEV